MRGILGVIGIGCAFMLGRSFAAVRKGWEKPRKAAGWAVRVVLCLGAAAIRHTVDAADIAIWLLSAVTLAVGWWEASRPKKEEDLTDQIFPED